METGHYPIIILIMTTITVVIIRMTSNMMVMLLMMTSRRLMVIMMMVMMMMTVFYDDDLFSPKKGDGVVLGVPNDRRRCQGGDFTSLLYQSLQIQFLKRANTIVKTYKYNY